MAKRNLKGSHTRASVFQKILCDKPTQIFVVTKVLALLRINSNILENCQNISEQHFPQNFTTN